MIFLLASSLLAFPQAPPGPPATPAIPRENRINCHYYIEMTEFDCAAKGCIWSPLEVGSVEPWCVRPIAPREGRTDCGHVGTTQDECEKANCIWSPLEERSKEPWCFKPVDHNEEIMLDPYKWIDDHGIVTPQVITPNELAFGEFLQTAGQTVLSSMLTGGVISALKSYYKSGVFDAIKNGVTALFGRLGSGAAPSAFSQDALALFNMIKNNADAATPFMKAYSAFSVAAGSIGARKPDLVVRVLKFMGHNVAASLVQAQIDPKDQMNDKQISAVTVQALAQELYKDGQVPDDGDARAEFEKEVENIASLIKDKDFSD